MVGTCSISAHLNRTRDRLAEEKEFREAARIQPGNQKVQANLGSVLASRNENAEARYHF